MALNTAARVWGPYKELLHTVQGAIQRNQPEAAQDLEVALRKHKTDFISLLQNPVKNPGYRDLVQKAHKDGLPVQGQQGVQYLSQPFIQEALTLSDLFALNEYAAVELLMTAEVQQPFFPGLKRGLVGVVLYYDGRVSLVNALRILIQSRRGRTWSLGLSDDLVTVIMNFTVQLMSEGLANKILDLLRSLDEVAELDMLQKPEYRAIGSAKHKRQVQDKIKEVRSTLADCLFCWSCQSPLNKADTLSLLTYLRQVTDDNADGTLSDVTLTLMMALLYSLDPRTPDDNEGTALPKPPLFSDPTYIQDIHMDITSQKVWTNPGLRAVVLFTWAVTLRTLSQFPELDGVAECCERDELLVDMAVEENVFFFFRHAVLANPRFHNEEYYVRQMHNLLTDFIIQMPLKMKELRNRGDETARIIVANQQEGLEPPTGLRRDFEHLLYLIGDLYMKDSPDRQLALEFWCPQETGLTPGIAPQNSSFTYKPPQRQIGLSKFVRLAGDLLSPPLYMPYIHMLRGLSNGPQCAHHCFNLLHTNGLGGGGQVSTVSWDHIFLSMNQYYTNLRQEAPAMADLAHIYRHHPRGITTQELDGLSAVIQLTRQIVFWDERARISLCENQQWLPLVLMLGLLCCNIPAKLKSDILRTLAALCKTPDIAASFWQSLEVSQIIPTFSVNTGQRKGGLHVELDEIEARDEEFPMTRAFLEMMSTLTDSPIPAGLGSGYRAPGFRPYLDFLRDSIFLKFNTRAYRNPAEKWEVASMVLEVLHKILQEYAPSSEDFVSQSVEVQGEGLAQANKPPGFTLMEHMLNDSPMLKMILYILSEGNKLLEKYVAFPGKEHLEQSVLWCLKMLETAGSKQESFLDALRDSPATTILVSQIDKLLMSINPRSGKADHLINVAKYVMYNSWLPDHALSAVRILSMTSSSALVQPKIVGLFSVSERVSASLRHGFVECLENPEDPEDDASPDKLYLEELTTAQTRNETRQEIVRLMLRTLNQPAPNLAHFLLGFETRKPVAKTNLQDPGVLECPRTCLHAVLSLLNDGVTERTGPVCTTRTPRLAELAYQLVYMLCANKDTSGPTMRYLRTHDFLNQHLQHLPFRLQDDGEPTTCVKEGALLSQQSWLLRTVAIELRLTSVNRQRSHTQRLLNLLLDDTPVLQQNGLSADDYDTEYSQYDMEYSMFTTAQIQYHQALAGSQARRKVLSILDSISFAQELPEVLQLDFFNPSLVEQVIGSCEQKNDLGVMFCHVRSLHRILTSDLHGSQATGLGQRTNIVQEIQNICASVVERNAYRDLLHAKKQTFDAWRQVIEIILTACPEDILQGEPRQSVIFELLQDLLVKVAKEDAVSELISPVAGVLLTLMANLRQCFLADPEEGSTGGGNITQYVTMLDGAHAASVSVHADMFGGQSSGARTLFASSLQVVLKGLIEHLMRSSSSTQRVRAYLYGSLLYYLQIAQKPKSLLLETSASDGSVASKITSKENEFERLSRENMNTFSSYGDNLMEVVCRDACDGHDIGRTLALATLDLILCLDKAGVWLSHLTSKGYLQHVIDSLVQDDTRLRDMLQQQPEPLKALYIFESKIGLLTRVAETVVGAHTLLQSNLTTKLAECSIFDFRPEVESSQDSGRFIPAVMTRYRQQILFPALKLCLAVLTSTGIENRRASNHVLRFILAHGEVFSAILRDRHEQLSLESLEELSLTTAVIGRAALDDSLEEFDGIFSDTSTVELRGALSRLQWQMLALLPRYSQTERLHRQLKALDKTSDKAGPSSSHIQEQAELAVNEISSNVIAFCRALISKSSNSGQFIRVLFKPNLVEALGRDFRMQEDLQGSMVNLGRSQNLGMIVYILQQSTRQFLATFESRKHHLSKFNNIPNLSAEEVKEFCRVSNPDKLSSQQKQTLARRRLRQIVARKSQEQKLFSYIIENCLFILWRHLEYYLIHCMPSDRGSSLLAVHTKKQQMIRRLDSPGYGGSFADAEEALEESLAKSSGVTSEELDQLKVDAVVCVNETLFSRLVDIEKSYTRNRTRYGFVEALIRRLKRLLKLHTGLT